MTRDLYFWIGFQLRVWLYFANDDWRTSRPYVKEWFAKLPDPAGGGVKTTRMEVQPARVK
jgi:hypothetical protein